MAPAPRPSRCGAKLVAAGLLGYAGVLKFTADPAAREIFTEIGMEPAGRWLIGALEVLAALLVLLPASAVFGALLGLGIMCGAVLAHLTEIGMAGLQNAALVAAGCVTILVIRRHDAPFVRNLLER